MENAIVKAVSLKFIWVLSSRLAVKESKGSFELTVRPRLHVTKDLAYTLAVSCSDSHRGMAEASKAR